MKKFMQIKLQFSTMCMYGQWILILFTGSCQKPEKPNIVIFYTDDQGTMDAGCYGAKDIYTPNIDHLAKHGIMFTQAYGHTVSCPGRAALLTGRHPQRSEINEWTQGDAHAGKGINMPLSEVTIAEVLKGAGYKTAIFGKWHLGADLGHGPEKQGFDKFFGFRGGFIDNYIHFFLHKDGYHDLYDNTTELVMPGKYFPELMVSGALDYIEENKNSPMFLYIAFNLPHYPYQWDTLSNRHYDSIYHQMPMPRKDYARAISTADENIGRIMAALKKLDLADNTMIFFTSDNGHSTEDYAIATDDHPSGLPKGHNYGAMGGGGYTGKWRGAKSSFLEGGIRIPTIVSYPGKFPEGVVRDQVITNMDFLPTICDVLKIPLPENKIDGHSLIPVIRSEKEISAYDVLHFQWFDGWTVRKGKWKLIVNGIDTTDKFSGKTQKKRKMDSPFLANLEDENPEEINYAGQFPEIVKELTTLHEKWFEDVKMKDLQ